MPNATYRMSVIGRGGSPSASAVGMAAYGAGETLKVESIVAAAAYRSGEILHDRKQQKLFDYSDREDVRHAEILAPAHASEWALDRETLWNAVEARENRVNSQLARSLILALPRELDIEQNIALLREYVLQEFVARGMVADIAVHDKLASDGGTNPHAHVLLTLREITPEGEWAKNKNRTWNGWETKKEREQRVAEGRPSLIEHWREAWEVLQNDYLEEAELDARVSMQSYAERGINRTPQVHRGPAVHHIDGRGEESYVARHNTEVQQENLMREMVDAMLPAPDVRLPSPAFGHLMLPRIEALNRIQHYPAWDFDPELGIER